MAGNIGGVQFQNVTGSEDKVLIHAGFGSGGGGSRSAYTLSPGANFYGRCSNDCCREHGKEIVATLGFGTHDFTSISFQAHQLRCPTCNDTFESTNVYFYKCSWMVHWQKKLQGNKCEPATGTASTPQFKVNGENYKKFKEGDFPKYWYLQFVVRALSGKSYVTVNGTNGFKDLNIPSGMKEAMLEHNKAGKTFKCVALGQNGEYFVSRDDGASSWAHSDGFSEKIRSIDVKEIKQVSFGPHGSYAIVMENGACHHCTLGKDDNDSGPYRKIEEWKDNIQSVAMTANSGEWIVVNKNDGWTGRGLTEAMEEKVRTVRNSSSQPVVGCCQLGSDAESWLVSPREGSYTYLLSCDDTHQLFRSDCGGSRLRAFW